MVYQVISNAPKSKRSVNSNKGSHKRPFLKSIFNLCCFVSGAVLSVDIFCSLFWQQCVMRCSFGLTNCNCLLVDKKLYELAKLTLGKFLPEVRLVISVNDNLG